MIRRINTVILILITLQSVGFLFSSIFKLADLLLCLMNQIVPILRVFDQSVNLLRVLILDGIELSE